MSKERIRVLECGFYIKGVSDMLNVKLPEIYLTLLNEMKKGNIKRKRKKMFDELLCKIYYSGYREQRKYEHLVCSQTIKNSSLEDLLMAFEEKEKYIEINGASTYEELGIFYAEKVGLIDENGNIDNRIYNFSNLGDYFATEVGTHWVDGIFYVDKKRFSAVLEDKNFVEKYFATQDKKIFEKVML